MTSRFPARISSSLPFLVYPGLDVSTCILHICVEKRESRLVSSRQRRKTRFASGRITRIPCKINSASTCDFPQISLIVFPRFILFAKLRKICFFDDNNLLTLRYYTKTYIYHLLQIIQNNRKLIIIKKYVHSAISPNKINVICLNKCLKNKFFKHLFKHLILRNKILIKIKIVFRNIYFTFCLYFYISRI